MLRYADDAAGPSGLTDPQLYVFTEPGPTKITTDCAAYHLSNGQNFPVANPTVVAVIISRSLEPAART